MWRNEHRLELEEKHMNTVMFWEMVIIPIVALIFVILFQHGTKKDAIVLLMTVSSIIIRIFEDKLGVYAKYLYTSIIPFWGAFTIVIPNDGKFGAMEHCYIWIIIVCIAGYDLLVLKVNIIVTIVSNVIAILICPEAYLKMHTLSVWIFILMLYIVAIVTAIDAYRRIHRRDRIRHRMKVYEHQMEIMRQTEKKVRGLRHDMKHHVFELKFLTEHKRYDDIMKYLEMMGCSMENASEYISTGNKEINSICNYMLERAVNAGVKIEAEGNIPEDIPIPYFEISSIIGNLLENAIEAAVKTKEPKLKIHMNLIKGVLYIRIVNSYNGIVWKKGKYYLSMKDGRHHGYGLKNVQDYVISKNGVVNIRYDDKNFYVDVLLYLSALIDESEELEYF